MPAPPSSGTGFLDATAWLQMWGESDGWKYMDALHENIAQYTHSGSKPCRQSGAGEFVIGISFEYRAQQVKKSGAPVMLVFPSEGLGWDIEATGIVKTTKKQEPRKSCSTGSRAKKRISVYASWWQVVAMPGIAELQPEHSRELRAVDWSRTISHGRQEPRQNPGRMAEALCGEDRE